MSGWWFSPAQLIGNPGLDVPLHFATTKSLTLSLSPLENKKQVFSSRVADFFFFLFWFWSIGRDEGKRANFLEVLNQG